MPEITAFREVIESLRPERMSAEEDIARKAYQKAWSDNLQIVTAVAYNDALTPIGGGAVQHSMAKAINLASKRDWNGALVAWNKAVADTAIVAKRKPYAEARRKHEANILAGTAITYIPTDEAVSYGEQLKTIWDASLQLAKSGDFDGAKGKIDEAATLIRRIDADQELGQKKQETKTARDNNKDAMDALLENKPLSPPQLQELLRLTQKEFDLAKEAEKVGDDPGKPSREPCTNPEGAEALFKKYDWFKLKDKLHDSEDQEVTTEVMWDLWRWRQEYVTNLIDSLRLKYPGLIAKASGSTDMESDIDITFAGPDGTEVDAAREFNQTVIDKFRKPAGRTFDVNIYPRDYNAIKESFNTDFNLEAPTDENIDHPEDEDMARMSQVDMDVATLLKQRRFLDQASFNKLLEAVVAGVEGEENKRQVMKQYEEGEDIYFLTSVEKVNKILEKLEEKESQISEETESWIKRYNSLKDASGLEAAEEMQNLIPALLERLEQEFEAEVMETTDALYLDKMESLRRDQAKIKSLDAPATPPYSEHHPDKTCEAEHPGEEHEPWRTRTVDAMKATVKRQQFENIVFANEAYMSQGAIEHIVAGAQAKKKSPDEAKQIIEGLTPQTIAQSCNEQMADFFKDMKHAKHEFDKAESEEERRRATGEAFVHASKYLVRLLDAAQLLVGKIKGLTFTLIQDIDGVSTPQELQEKVEDVLLALRKSAELSADVKAEIGIMQVQELFGVNTIEDFRKKISDFGLEFNTKVRNSEQYQQGQSVDIDTERQYFGADIPPKPSELNGLLAETEGQLMDANEALALEPIIGMKPQIEAALNRTEISLTELDNYNTEGLHEAHVRDLEGEKAKLSEKIQSLKNKIAAIP